MTTAIKVTGKQEFMGIDIPIVLGGFGDGKKAIFENTIASIHNIDAGDVRKAINRNDKCFKTAIDLIDLKRSSPDDDLLQSLGYSKLQARAEHIYILSESGYTKLIEIMDSDLAREIYDKLIDEYFDAGDADVLGGTQSELMLVEDQGLIKVYKTTKGEYVVKGRVLWEGLDPIPAFPYWIKIRLSECDAIEGVDYYRTTNKEGVQSLDEYIIKLDIAKEMAMLERNEIGKQYRRYFIEVEKKYQNAKSNIKQQGLNEEQEKNARRFRRCKF